MVGKLGKFDHSRSKDKLREHINDNDVHYNNYIIIVITSAAPPIIVGLWSMVVLH